MFLNFSCLRAILGKNMSFFKVSPYHLGFYNLWVLNPNRSDLNLFYDCKIEGDINLDLLEKIVYNYFSSHLIINSHLIKINDLLYFTENLEANKIIYEHNNINEESISNFILKPFNLFKSHLYRYKIIKINKNTFRIIFVFHHIIMDANGCLVLFNEIINSYNNQVLKKYTNKQIQINLCNELFTKQENSLFENFNSNAIYWEKLLKENEYINLNLLKKINLNNEINAKSNIFNHTSSYIQKKLNINQVDFSIPLKSNLYFENIIKKQRITWYIYSKSIFAITLYNLFKISNFSIKFQININPMQEYYGAQTNTLIIPFKISNDTNINNIFEQIKTFFKEIKDQNTKKMNYTLYQDSKFIDDLNKIEFSFSESLITTNSNIFNNTNVISYEVNSINMINNLNFLFEKKENSINFRVFYNKNKLNSFEINNFLNSYISTFNFYLDIFLEKDPTHFLKPIPSDHFKSKYKYKPINNEEFSKKIPEDKTLNEIFEDQVLLTPNKIALISENTELSYSDLNKKANQLAFYINNLINFKNETPILIYLERSELIFISIFGILKTGCSYVPIDTSLPLEKVNQIINEIKPKFILTSQKYFNVIKNNALNIDINIIPLDDQNTINVLNKKPIVNLNKKFSSKNLAYIIFTSGTTGKPKGVMVEHKSVINYLFEFSKNISDLNIVDFSGSIGFDLNIKSTLFPLLFGKKVCIYTDDIKNLNLYYNHLNKMNIELVISTPSFLNLLEADMINNKLKMCVVGGEKLTKPIRDHILNYSYQVLDEYGPTEATVGTTFFLMTSKNDHLCIGKPYDNYKTYVLDSNLNLCPIGVTGELYIGGECLARGYLNNSELTSEKFIQNPFQTELEKKYLKNSRIYKTGDLVRYLPNGNLEYIGRNDRQIKFRGFRIELEEIELAISEIEEIKQNVVIFCNKNILISFFVLKNEKTISDDKIKEILIKKLPNYMLPSKFVQIDKIPLNASGKIDFSYLIKKNPIVIKKSLEDITILQKDIINLWADILDIREEFISINDSFFEIGGNSILAIKLVSILQKNYQIDINHIFELKTIKNICTYLEKNRNPIMNKLNDLKKTLIGNKKSIKKMNSIEFLYKSEYKILLKEKNKIKNINNSEISNILLTGSTGYLGIHILHDLLKNPKNNVFLLIRDKSKDDATKRLLDLYFYYFDKDISHLIDYKIFIYPAEIELTNFNLPEENYYFLLSKIDLVIHSAALVKHYDEYINFYNSNIKSTNNLLKFSSMHKKKDFHFISTTSVCSNTYNNKNNIYCELNENIQGIPINYYVKSKLIAENLCLEYREKNININIYRVGNLLLNTNTFKMQKNIESNASYNLLNIFYKLKIIPEDFNQLEISPVNVVSESIVKTIEKIEFRDNIFHFFNSTKYSIIDLLYKIKPNNSYQKVSSQDFLNYLVENSTNPKLQRDINLLMLHLGLLNTNTSQFHYKNKIINYKSEMILRDLNIEWPNIPFEKFDPYFSE
nr:hypothetical protein GTC16762_19160 [Pigmentibacter ruber]